MLALGEIAGLIGVFMPAEWIMLIHERLGLGTLSAPPATFFYLAHHLSLFYVLHGGLLWVAASDVRKYDGIIAFNAWAGIVFSFGVGWLGFQAGFPWYWIVMEGPLLAALSIVILVLQRRIVRPSAPA